MIPLMSIKYNEKTAFLQKVKFKFIFDLVTMKHNRYLKFLCVVFLVNFGVRVFLYLSNFDTDLIGQKEKQRYHNFWNDTKALEIDHVEEISMEEYLRFYKLDDKLHHTCPHVRRPHPGEISWKKGIYQHVRMKFDNNEGITLGVKQ